jgi:DNA-binding MarR family transcriptional regulator
MAKWLTQEEQSSWRAWLSASRMLTEQLSKELSEKHGLSIADYVILVQLSESPDHQVRMSDLAEQTLASRSRLSHQIDRMEQRGLVRREACSDDRRGYFAILTDAGLRAIVEAAPDHVAGVRTHLVDLLGPANFAALGDACARVTEHLESMHLDSIDSKGECD